jgi:hypothetical protein
MSHKYSSDTSYAAVGNPKSYSCVLYIVSSTALVKNNKVGMRHRR